MCVWNLATGNPLGTNLPGHVQPPNSLRFFNHDQQLASAGDDGTIRIWNLADSQQQRVIEPEHNKLGSRHWIRAMDVSPDGKYIVSSGMDDTVRLWEISTSREIYRLPGHGPSGGNRAVRFTPDSKQFASWGDDMRVYQWDIATGKALQDFDAKPDGTALKPGNQNPFDAGPGAARIDEGRFSPDAAILMFIINGGNVYRFSVVSGKEIPMLARGGGFVSRFASSFDNQYMLATSSHRAQVVQLPDGSQKHISPTTFPAELWSLADEKIVASGEVAGTGADRVTFSSDGRRVAIAVVGDQPHLEILTVPQLASVFEISLPSRAEQSNSPRRESC